MSNESPVKAGSGPSDATTTTKPRRREPRARPEEGRGTEVSDEGSAQDGRAEHVAVIGGGDIAELVTERARRAGWDVESIPLFPGARSAATDGLGDRSHSGLTKATIVVVATPASAHPTLSVLLAGSLRPDALVLLLPGQVGGALELARSLAPGGKGPVIAETSWSPWVRTADDVIEVGELLTVDGDTGALYRGDVTAPATAEHPAERQLREWISQIDG